MVKTVKTVPRIAVNALIPVVTDSVQLTRVVRAALKTVLVLPFAAKTVVNKAKTAKAALLIVDRAHLFVA